MEIRSEIMEFAKNLFSGWGPYEIKRVPSEYSLDTIKYVAITLKKDVIGVMVDDEERMMLIPNPWRNDVRMLVISERSDGNNYPLVCVTMSDPMLASPTKILDYYSKEYSYERKKLSYSVVPVISGPNEYQIKELGDEHA